MRKKPRVSIRSRKVTSFLRRNKCADDVTGQSDFYIPLARESEYSAFYWKRVRTHTKKSHKTSLYARSCVRYFIYCV